MVVGTVAVILICCIALFLDRYRSAMVQSAQTSSAQAVSQVSNTVGSYLSDMDQAMRLVEQSVSESGESRDRLLAAFLKFRPDVVAVTSYSADGELLDCWSPDRRAQGEHPAKPLLRPRHGPRHRRLLHDGAACGDDIRGLLPLGRHDDGPARGRGARPPGSRWT